MVEVDLVEIGARIQDWRKQLSWLSQRDRKMIELLVAYCAAREE